MTTLTGADIGRACYLVLLCAGAHQNGKAAKGGRSAIERTSTPRCASLAGADGVATCHMRSRLLRTRDDD